MMFIAALLSYSSFAQDLQNANWYFGDRAGLNFNGPVTELTDMPSTSTFFDSYILEGCASISDKTGELLFYTNGETVYSKDHSVMDNGTGLYGNESSTQNAIIIPKPGNKNNFYIVTIDGESGTYFGQTLRGLYYSEVDMTLNGGLGKVIMKNTALKDHLGVLINSSYNYGTHPKQEKLTATFNSDGINYWMITQIKNYVYSYSVTSSGISLTPTHNYMLPIASSIGYGSFIKISSNGSRIATSFSLINSGIGVYSGSFDAATGQMNLNASIPIATANEMVSSIEFSPNSDYLYFTVNNQTLYAWNYLTSVKTTIATSPVGNPGIGRMQLAMDGVIYILSNVTNKISTLSNPNNLSSPGYSFQSLTLTRNYSAGLPQLVYWHEMPCESLLLAVEPNTTFIYDDKSTITTHLTYAIASGKDISMKASEFVHLKPDSHIVAGAKYWAKIEPCEDVTEPRPGANDQGKESQEMQDLSLNRLFTLSPNPASESVLISSSERIQSLSVTSFEGKVIFSKNLNGKNNSFELYVRDYINGFYTITVTTVDGKVETQKLIKD